MRRSVVIFASLLFVLAASASAVETPWDLDALYKPPLTFDAPDLGEKELRALYYESVPFKGKPARVFAWYGAPKGASKDQRVPAMVLVHGGGGTAFAQWVKMWNERGYAALAMDTGGGIPSKEDKSGKVRHEFAGAPGGGGFDQMDWELEDQWPYQAVAAVILGHSLLRSFPEVDVGRTGITGISWGGFLTSTVAGVDRRFKVAVPVYGCGFYRDSAKWQPGFAAMGAEKAGRWQELWDPLNYLSGVKCPIMWVNGTNDFAFSLPSIAKSSLLPKSPVTLCIKVGMQHSHTHGWEPREIPAFVDSVLRKEPPLPRVKSEKVDGRRVTVKFDSKVELAKAELNFTRETTPWKDRKWETQPAELKDATATANLPEGAAAWFVNVIDAKGNVSSSRTFEIQP